MWATVSGDVNGTFYGDVAYYMEGVDGVFVDPELMEMMGRLMSMGEGGVEDKDSFAAFLERELGTPQLDKELGAGVGSNFLLTLQDFKIDGEELPSAPGGDPVLGMLGIGDSETQDAVRQVFGMLAGQFALGIKGTVVAEGPGEGPIEGPKQPKIEINQVTATVGAADEGDRIPFDVVNEADLKVFLRPESDAIYGTFSGDLSTRKSYTLPNVKSRQLQVHIEANFTALRGQTTCVKR